MATENEDKTQFSSTFVAKLMNKHFTEESQVKLLAKDPSADLCAELLRVFVMEACVRSANQAQNEGSPTCDVVHVEKILPQLLLDF